MSLAERLTESPRTEYSLLEPAVPTTPARTIPVAMPILHLQLRKASSYLSINPAMTALTGSS
jgi:hypothetical protein